MTVRQYHQTDRKIKNMDQPSFPKAISVRTRSRGDWRFRYGLVTAVMVMGVTSVGAQTLDAQIRRLLGKDPLDVNQDLYCAQLVGYDRTARTLGVPNDFGPQLSALCTARGIGAGGPAVGQTAFAGGALSSIGQADQVVKKRRLKAGTEESKDVPVGGGASADSEMALGSNMNLFFSGEYQSFDRLQTRFEQGYDSNQKGFTLGTDFLMTNWLITGLAFNYSHWHGDFLGNAGGFATDSYGPILFASLFLWEGFFTDFSFQYSHKEGTNTNQRNYLREDNTQFGGSIDGRPISNQYEGNLMIGYDHPFGSLTIGPRVNVRYRHADINGYTENGSTGLELRFLDDSLNSLQTSLGAQASVAISTAWGVLVPQLNADWTHEHNNDQRTIRVQFAQDNRPIPTTFGFQTDRPDRDFFHVGAGVVAVLPNGFQAFANFETLLGHAYFDNYIGTVGLRLGM